MRIASLLAFVVAVSLTADLPADEVYKCTSPSGTIAFQDHECASGDTETSIHIDNPRSAPVDAPQPATADAAPIPAPPEPPPTRAVQSEPPAMWLCTRAEDGTRYMSSDGAPPTRLVPAGVLGMPGKSLANAYGKDGIGVSAPGVRKIPVDTSPQASVASDYVPVQDQCEPASTQTTCAYLHDQYDKIHAKLRRAFKDEQAVLQPQLDALDAQLDGC